MGDAFFLGFGGGFMWLFWLPLVVGVIWALKGLFAVGSDRDNKRKSTLDILEERYTRDEIDREAFNKMKRDLQR